MTCPVASSPRCPACLYTPSFSEGGVLFSATCASLHCAWGWQRCCMGLTLYPQLPPPAPCSAVGPGIQGSGGAGLRWAEGRPSCSCLARMLLASPTIAFCTGCLSEKGCNAAHGEGWLAVHARGFTTRLKGALCVLSAQLPMHNWASPRSWRASGAVGMTRLDPYSGPLPSGAAPEADMRYAPPALTCPSALPVGAPCAPARRQFSAYPAAPL